METLRPLLLRPDNFTPPTRTPWGGRKIMERYKPGVDSEARVVGESWEVSVEPSFPSVIEDSELTLAQVIARDPRGWLGKAVAKRYGGQTPLLIKLLDADDNLSVQVHPAEDDPALGPQESGKPESWLVLEAEPGAGLYLGFREGVGRREVEGCLREGGRLDALMNFVPVQSGDAFVIQAGTAHAIGRGVTLVEPQHVTPGRCGVTYRFWDWNRLYDDLGRRSPQGKPRALHLERSLEVTCWDAPGGEAFVQSCRARPRVLRAGGLERAKLLKMPWFEVERLRGTGLRELRAGTMSAVVCVGGEAVIKQKGFEIPMLAGRSAVVPPGEFTVEGRWAELVVVRSVA